MEGFLLEKLNIKLANPPVDGNTAAIVGARVSMAKGERVTFLAFLSASTAAVGVFALKQHNAASSGTTKALSIMNPYFYKLGAATVFTKVEPVAAADTYDLSTLLATDGGIVAFECLQEDLDVDNNFSHVSINMDDTTAAKVVALAYIVHPSKRNPAYNEVL